MSEPDTDRYWRAIASIDAANAKDPNSELVDGVPVPKELVYSRRMTGMLERFAPGAPETVRLAVRCQHIRRWETPRASYPATPAGYQAWRAGLLKFHAEAAAGILRDAGYDAEAVARVMTLLRKQGVKRDPDVQLLEDVASLVFLEHYAADFARTHPDYDEAKLIDILMKTLKKMSSDGRAAAVSLLRPPEAVVSLLRKALEAA
jgi:hypothetical protein